MIRDEAVQLIYNVKVVSAPINGYYIEGSDFRHKVLEDFSTRIKDKAYEAFDSFYTLTLARAKCHKCFTPSKRYKVIMTVTEKTASAKSLQNKEVLKEEEIYDLNPVYSLPIDIKTKDGKTKIEVVEVRLPKILDEGQSHMTYIRNELERLKKECK